MHCIELRLNNGLPTDIVFTQHIIQRQGGIQIVDLTLNTLDFVDGFLLLLVTFVKLVLELSHQ